MRPWATRGAKSDEWGKVALRTHPLEEVMKKKKRVNKSKFHSLDTDFVPSTELSILQI